MNKFPDRALVVEDDLSWQQILSEILEDCGLVVDRAANLDQAMLLVRSNSHRLAVLDIALDGPNHSNQDGLKVLETLQRADPTCTSVVLTGFATVELAVNVILEKGAYTCLRKETFRRAEFRKLVFSALTAAPGPGPEKLPSGHGSPAQPHPAASAIQVGKEKALLVEDDAGWRSLLGELLQDAGFQVDQGVSYMEALGLLRQASYRLLVTDLSLASSLGPEINQDGLRLLAFTQKTGIAAMVVSGYAEPAEIEKAYTQYNLFACLEKKGFDRKKFTELARKARQLSAGQTGLPELTGREKEVLAFLAQGLTNKEMAVKMGISTNTVKRHLKSLFARLGVNTRAGASAFASRPGLLK
jgi:DNA-binding NarL/FixJ family response regulator